MTTTFNYATAPGHQVLAAAGKRILRPGGKAATEKLFSWANFQPGETVLELAASFGESAIEIAKRFNVRVVGIENNPDSVAKARENIKAAGLSDRITIIEGDIFELNQITEKFDYVLAEAILTMQSNTGKAKILSAIKDCLKPGGKFLSHEMLVRSHESEVRKSLSQTIRVNANPLTIEEWQTVCKKAGLSIQQQQTGAMGLLNFDRILRDEGLFRTIKIVWNVLTNSDLRQRVLQMRRSFQQQRHNIGNIVFWAKISN
ncbi:methyltransferase domain-containing protein [Plectonema cf. radiosum LEGE 06105]|uniref:Methyltransferase domain-containing protein n=1 Tax=Plectonema cf. radiosum LEGE 06105 TaxID=945769 RepID=A0A8J7K1S2_9CYAN|nr:class I SAM-dependent methyltransferase [Plectonema radiosum]MBE9213382.1 methyltransferase domain-containing protein [Plectonema cf. radiosum LEGE 06105]